MCGIFGILNKESAPFDYTTFTVLGINNDSRGGDSCGVFMDGQVEYGVEKNKFFEDFLYDSVLVQTTEECRIAIGHCRKASVGKVALETAQPVCLYDETGNIEYMLIHNGTLHNYEELAKKYIPNIEIKGMTDSQVLARILYHCGWDVLGEYNGGAAFVAVDYRKGDPRVYMFKGKSVKYASSKEAEDERPFYISLDQETRELVFSSIPKYLQVLRPYNDLRTIPANTVIGYYNGCLAKIKEIDRSNCQQNKKYAVATNARSAYGYGYGDYDDTYAGTVWNGTYSYTQTLEYDYLKYRYKLGGKFVNGSQWVSKYGTVFKEKPSYASTVVEMYFFEGIAIPTKEAYDLILECYNDLADDLTKEDFIEIFENIIRFLSFDQIYLDDRNRIVKATAATEWETFSGKHQLIGSSHVSTISKGMVVNSVHSCGNYPDVTKTPKVNIKQIKKIWKPLMK